MNILAGLASEGIVMGKKQVTISGSQPDAATLDVGPLRPGDILGERYRIEEEIGRGGMAVVYRATNNVGTSVAIKTPHAVVLSNPELCQRFLQEATALARLSGSRHVVHVLDKHEGDHTAPPYIVMELLVGRDLGCDLERGPLPQREAVHLALQICDALADAHAAGLVHRDLKPSNLFLSGDEEGHRTLKILDLGIARVPASDTTLRTETGAFLGSPPYAAPEQLRSARRADERSDVWSLGVTLYEMLTERRPFAGRTLDELKASVQRSFVRPSVLRPDLSAGLEEIILACLEQDPKDRPSVAQLARRLSDFAPSDLRVKAESIERRAGVSPSSTRSPADSPAPPRSSRPVAVERSTFSPVERATFAPPRERKGIKAGGSTAQKKVSLTGPIALGAACALVALALWGWLTPGPVRAAAPTSPPTAAVRQPPPAGTDLPPNARPAPSPDPKPAPTPRDEKIAPLIKPPPPSADPKPAPKIRDQKMALPVDSPPPSPDPKPAPKIRDQKMAPPADSPSPSPDPKPAPDPVDDNIVFVK